jgi:hypothetical protein
MFNRVLVLTSLFTAGLVGCSLHRHHDCGCGEHGRVQNVVGHRGESTVCSCTPPLFPGDQGCHGNCPQHARQRPLRQLATKFRRSAPSWFRGPHGDNCGCGACGTVSCGESLCADGTFVSGAGMYPQSVCSQPVWDTEGTCGCDSCSLAMTANWQIDGTFSSGAYSATAGPSGCGCGEHFTPHPTTSSSGESWEYSNPDNSPLMDGHVKPSESGDARTFAPSGPHGLPIPPDSSSKPAPMPPADSEPVPMPMPMPQDMTPMDSDSASPKDTLFEPLSEEGAPAAESPVDPMSYEVPLLPPLPIPDHASSGKRVALPYAK